MNLYLELKRFFLFIFILAVSNICFAINISENELRNLLRSRGLRSISKEEVLIDLKVNKDELYVLGRNLFYDKILSGNKNISCATCHHPLYNSTDALPVPIGQGGNKLGPVREQGTANLIPRNAPAAFNLGLSSFHTAMWDGRISINPVTKILTTPESKLNGSSPILKDYIDNLTSLAALQAMFPVTSNDEMLGTKGDNEVSKFDDRQLIWEKLTERLMNISAYREQFFKAYPLIRKVEDFNFSHAAKAIGYFEGVTFLANKSKFDQFMDGNNNILNESQKRGANLFVNEAKCIQCHNGAHFTDFAFHSLATPQLGPGKNIELGEPLREDRGRYLITKDLKDIYKFKTPTLRNVMLTGPWMHDGAFNKIEDVIYQHINPLENYQRFISSPNNCIDSLVNLNFKEWIDNNNLRISNRLMSIKPDELTPKLSTEDINDLINFLDSLTDTYFKSKSKQPMNVLSGLRVED